MIILNLIILLLYILLWYRSRNYEIDLVHKLDEKKYRMKQFFPLGLFVMEQIDNIRVWNKTGTYSDKLDDILKAIFIGEKVDIVKRYYQCNKVVFVLLLIFISNLLSLFSNVNANNYKQLFEGYFIERPGYNEGTKEVALNVHISEDGVTVLEDEIELEIEEKHYDSEELNKMFAYAKEYIDSKILNTNESEERIQSNLTFVTQIPGTGLSVKWRTENSDLIDERGIIHNEELSDAVLTGITAVISYHEQQEEYTRFVRILPKEYSKEELARKDLTEAINNINSQSLTENKVLLPKRIGEQSVAWAEEKDNTGSIILLLGIVSAFLLFGLMDKELLNKVANRNKEMLLDYPEIINKFTLLVGAGMSLSNAWCKICQDYKEIQKGKRYAYEEMMITYGELMIGTSETIAYERFGRRVKLLPYLRFSSLLAQNVKKGSSSLFEQLELEVIEAFEERKELAKRLGEEAGTKLLGPMMCMLLIVLAIIIVPAFISFGI